MTRLLLVFVLSSTIFNAQSFITEKRFGKDSVHFDITNPYLAPLQLHLEPLPQTEQHIKVKRNIFLRYEEKQKNTIVLPLHGIKDTSTIDLSKFVRFSGSFGDPTKTIDPNFEYHLPYKKGKSYKLIQGFGGHFSHRDKNSKYALDFNLKIGDTITAARAGTVFYIKENSNRFCGSKQCNNMANNILILHSDGTIGHYVHLRHHGVLVNVGDKIDVDQPIGISGMTGFTIEPHLHFVVLKSGNVAIPIKFKGQKTRVLKQGYSYRRLYD